MRNEVVENCLYMIGEARDFLEREEQNVVDLMGAVLEGRVSPAEATIRIREAFGNAHKDLREWEGILANLAGELDFPYLHPALQQSIPLFRLIKNIPEGIA